MKKWYSASILFRGIKNISIYPDIWEESICLFEAENEDEVRIKAEKKGKSEEVQYQSIPGNTVNWIYDGILNIYDLSEDSIGDGAEVFSRFLSEEEVRNLRTPFKDE